MRFAWPHPALPVLASALSILASSLLTGCPNSTPASSTGGISDAGLAQPCKLPGTVQFTASGRVTLPGGSALSSSLDFLTLPAGFCAHYFGAVGNARQMRFSPSGDLFVASPTTLTTGGGQGGLSAIVVLPDDNQDGAADAVIPFLQKLPSTQGLLFTNGSLYYQDGTKIVKQPFKAGDRAPSGTSTVVADITYSVNPLHWPKSLDVADDGKIYVGNGGGQADPCVEPHPTLGGIVLLDGTPGGTAIVKGLRNPIAVRCAPGHDQCFALELAKDYTATMGGREKLIPIRPGDDWGFPCCATQALPYGMVTNQDGGTPDCSGTVSETVALRIGDTPFGLDFERGTWPAAWAKHAFVATHGAAGSWIGARIVAVPMDPTSGLPSSSSDTSGNDQGLVDFATGWDDGTLEHGRPAAVAFSPDGRLFVANDANGVIFWIAAM
jgi:glucose/arabinose dehydrogenase